MPIRSPRGRSAAYRSIWQWPLRSPTRLVLALAVLVVIGIGVGYAVRAVGGTPPAGSAPASGAGASSTSGGPSTGRTPAPTSPTALPPVPELTPRTLPPSSAPAAALAVAARWSAAWIRPPEGTTPQQWLEGLRPLTTEEYLGVLSGVDPQNIPATRVTGEPRAVRVAERSVQAEVPTDTLTLVVLVVDTETGWRVAGHDRR